MSNLNGRKVSLLRMHSTAHVLGLGELGAVITPVSNKAKLELTLTDAGVHATGNSTAPGNQKVEFVIPFANCASIELVRE